MHLKKSEIIAILNVYHVIIVWMSLPGTSMSPIFVHTHTHTQGTGKILFMEPGYFCQFHFLVKREFMLNQIM